MPKSRQKVIVIMEKDRVPKSLVFESTISALTFLYFTKRHKITAVELMASFFIRHCSCAKGAWHTRSIYTLL